MRNPSYILQNSYGIWYFRIAVPKHLRYTLKLKELKKSLRTLNRYDALRQARKLAVGALDLFDNPKLTSDMVTNWLKIKTTTSPDGSVTEEIEADPSKPEEEARLLKAYRESKYSANTPVWSPQENLLFSQAAKKYEEHITIQDKWDDKTLDENRAIYQVFIECVTDLSLDEITGDTAEEFLRILKALPPNRKKLLAFKNKSIKQIVAMKLPGHRTMAKETINKHIRRISQLFNWAVKSKLMQTNPFSEFSIKDRSKSKKRYGFDDQDIQKLLCNLEIDRREPHKYWLPILAAYTGARLEELAQLHTSDIQTIDGIECICFTETEDEEDKSFKTKNAIRKVQIHSKLKELNFLQFWALQKLSGHKRLFPNLKPDRYGKFSSSFSKYFTRYRRKCGIDSTRKTFHSFRHTVATKLKLAEMDDKKSAAVIGHYHGTSFTFSYYGGPFLPKDLTEVVEAIDYGSLFSLIPKWEIH